MDGRRRKRSARGRDDIARVPSGSETRVTRAHPPSRARRQRPRHREHDGSWFEAAELQEKYERANAANTKRQRNENIAVTAEGFSSIIARPGAPTFGRQAQPQPSTYDSDSLCHDRPPNSLHKPKALQHIHKAWLTFYGLWGQPGLADARTGDIET